MHQLQTRLYSGSACLLSWSANLRLHNPIKRANSIAYPGKAYYTQWRCHNSSQAGRGWPLPQIHVLPPPPPGADMMAALFVKSGSRIQHVDKPQGVRQIQSSRNFFAIWLVSLCILYLACTESCLEDYILYPCVSGCICAHMAAAAAVYLPVSGLLLACNQP
jgi:hypothetical protein